MNEVTLIGNIGSEIIVKETANSKKVVNFSLATNEKYTTKDGQEKTETDWHDITAFGCDLLLTAVRQVHSLIY